MTLRVINWNVEWATPRSERSPEILRRIAEHDPEIICLTETNDRLLDGFGGHTIQSLPDYGHRMIQGRRKVMLWSRNPWCAVAGLGSAVFPSGRLVAGVTDTSEGPVTVVGVCIPWSGSRTKRFGGNCSQWEDHDSYLDGLKTLFQPGLKPRMVVIGDYNQSVGGRNSAPIRLRDKLKRTFDDAGLRIATASLEFGGRRAIDHMALTPDLDARSMTAIGNLRDDGGKLSDHFGVVADLSINSNRNQQQSVE